MCTYRIFSLVVILAAAGCATVPRDARFAEVEGLLEERILQQVHWYQGGAGDAAVDQRLRELLAAPLGLNGAVQVALLNNRRLQAEYENLGVAQADLVQAGLLSNPTFFASVRFPHGGGRANTEFDLAQNFLDLLLRPARLRLAETAFERARLRTADAVLDLAAEVTVAYRNVQGVARLVEILRVLDESAQASHELAQRFEAAGNLSERRLAQERGLAAETRAELLSARGALQAVRDELSRLLNINGGAREWTLAELLPPLPAADPDPAAAEAIAAQRRFDLAEMHREIAQLADAVAITRGYRYIGGASVGVSTERETDGTNVTGPNFAVELPIFDQRQAEIARLESLHRQAGMRAAALESEIRSDVRAAFHRVAAARAVAEYFRDEVVPAGEQVLKFTQQEQNYMLIDAFELLLAHRQARAAYRGQVEAVRDYWVARADLARAAGTGDLPEAEPATLGPAPDGKETPGRESQDSEHDRHNEMQH